jgi:hypothetical protein
MTAMVTNSNIHNAVDHYASYISNYKNKFYEQFKTMISKTCCLKIAHDDDDTAPDVLKRCCNKV